jgi:hypothetical protein
MHRVWRARRRHARPSVCAGGRTGHALSAARRAAAAAHCGIFPLGFALFVMMVTTLAAASGAFRATNECVNRTGEAPMKTLIAIAVIAGAGVIAAASSQAMPLLAPVQQDEASGIIKVAEGCGAGGHRGPYGHCRPRYSCPWGWHPGPYGWHCFRN